MKRGFSILAILLITVTAQAQDASARLMSILEKYGQVPAYKLNVTYESVNERMGFSNTQNGVLVVEGDKYIMTFGPNETWLNDGTTEYIGTKEEDHSQILYFCAGQNTESIVDFGAITTFFTKDHKGVIEGLNIRLRPNNEMPYVEVFVETKDGNLTAITATDDFGTAHKFILSNFSTNTAGTKFIINPKEYEEKIDERKGCK
ncbi:LolA family protein [Roseivirga sp.]|uniref:LolA family protein n=1 Tax=Roseivirga sp. TaxID=1964215 RepID=UPI003B8E1C72